MAITNAIMQMRRGNEADFNPENMREGEWAVSLDTKYIRMCFAPNVCIRMATYEAFEEDMETVQQILSTCETIQSAVESIQANIEGIEIVVENYVNSSNASALLSESYAIGGTGSRIGEDTDNAMYYKEQARIYSERAESATDVSIATLDKAGIVKPDGETIDVGLDGTISVVGEFGTADYTDLQNKPTLNGITLEGNKTLAEFGAFSGNYNDLENKPTIPSVATSTVAGTVKPDGTTTEVDEDGTLHVIGGGGTSVDILATKEEVEANTEAGKIADALVTKELSAEIAQISSSLSAINQSIGNLSSLYGSKFGNLVEVINYWIDNGYLSNPLLENLELIKNGLVSTEHIAILARLRSNLTQKNSCTPSAINEGEFYVVTAKNTNASTGGACTLYFENIDLTNFKKIVIQCETLATSEPTTAGARLIVAKSISSSYSTTKNVLSNKTDSLLELDVSDLNGTYSVAFEMYIPVSSTRTFNIKNFYLVR